MFFSNPSVEIGSAALIVLYLGSAKMSDRHLRSSQFCALVAVALVFCLTLDGPIDTLEDGRLFTAHMVQHLVLALVAPPLLLFATPDWLLRPLVQNPPIRSLARFFTRPLIAYIIYNLTLVGLHSPQVFDLMCGDERIHIALHLLLLVTATLLWWPLLSPLPEYPRLSYPAQLLYVFLWLIPMAAVAAPITIASDVIYPWYRLGPHPFGLSDKSDQVLGGLTMWVGAGFYLIGVFTSIFFRWARRQDLDEPEFNFQTADVVTLGHH